MVDSRSILLLALLGAAAVAAAETASTIADLKPGTRILSYLMSGNRGAALNDVGRAFDRQFGLHQACTEPYRIKLLSLTIGQPIELADDKEHPSKGVWTQRFEFERCGEMKVYNAFFVAKSDGPPEARPYLPGTTAASATLVRDALKTAAGVAQLALGKLRTARGPAECNQLMVSDTRVTKPAQGGAWEESWEFIACELKVPVLMRFTPDSKGGTHFTASAGAATNR
jgi:hypothetical protein